MANQPLRAVVIGAGWAGEGHTRALQACGIEVVAICARQPAVVQAVADRLGIPLAATDWRQTLLTLKPEIVALTTPAALRGEVITVLSRSTSFDRMMPLLNVSPFPYRRIFSRHYRKWEMKSRTSGRPLAATLWPIFAGNHTRPILLSATAGAIRRLLTPSVRGVAGLRCPHNGMLRCFSPPTSAGHAEDGRTTLWQKSLKALMQFHNLHKEIRHEYTLSRISQHPQDD